MSMTSIFNTSWEYPRVHVMFSAKLVLLAQICDKLSCRKAKFPRILSQNGKNDLEGQGQWPPLSIPADSIQWCMFDANLVIPAQICDELSHGKGKVYGWMDGRTDRRRQQQYPFDLKGQWVKRRSENDNTPQPLDQWTNSPFVGQQVGNCKSFILTHYLADLFAMHHGPRSIPLCIQHHIQLTSLSFHVSRPSHS